MGWKVGGGGWRLCLGRDPGTSISEDAATGNLQQWPVTSRKAGRLNCLLRLILANNGTNGWDDQATKVLTAYYCSHTIVLTCSKLLLKLLKLPKHVLNSFREMITRGDLQSAHHQKTFIPATRQDTALSNPCSSHIILHYDDDYLLSFITLIFYSIPPLL